MYTVTQIYRDLTFREKIQNAVASVIINAFRLYFKIKYEKKMKTLALKIKFAAAKRWYVVHCTYESYKAQREKEKWISVAKDIKEQAKTKGWARSWASPHMRNTR